MGRIVVSQFTTIDGIVEDPGGSEGVERGGWAFRYDRGEDGNQFKLDEVMESEALLLGRVTYEGFAAAWPSRTGDFADTFNTMPKYVVSKTLSQPEWSNSTVVGGDLAETVERIKGAHEGTILVNGSVQLVSALTELGLVDELRLMVFPVVLGAGKRLVGATVAAAPFRLAEARPVGPDGVVVLRYEAVRA